MVRLRAARKSRFPLLPVASSQTKERGGNRAHSGQTGPDAKHSPPMKRTVVICLIVLAGCASSAKTGSTSKGLTAKGSKDPTTEVKITTCAKGALGDVAIKGTATNDTSKRSDFLIDLAVTDRSGKTQLGTGNAIAQNVEPGQTALWDGFTVAKWQAGIVCKVSTVSRTASL